MKQITEMSINRTGLGQSNQRKKGATPSSSASREELLSGIEQTRREYVEISEPIGSVPFVESMSFDAGLSLFIDKLGERMAFERAGVRLYEALILKCEIQSPQVDIEHLRQFRADELRHFHLVSDVLEKILGDPTVQTPSADIGAVEGQGLMQVLTDSRTSVEQCVHAIRTVELVDNDGWELLIKLAKELGRDEVIDSFQEALETELEHLDYVRRWHEQLVLKQKGREPQLHSQQ